MRVVTASPIAKSVIAGQPAHRRDVDVDGGVIADADRDCYIVDACGRGACLQEPSPLSSWPADAPRPSKPSSGGRSARLPRRPSSTPRVTSLPPPALWRT